jgi:CPA2 family monovalent cation:H+ antiporter-2/glutathione-regulated potassium-efflux system protein KefB
MAVEASGAASELVQAVPLRAVGVAAVPLVERICLGSVLCDLVGNRTKRT